VIATVLIPTWRAPLTLGRAVRSALRQTVHDLEVLVVGDGVEDEIRAGIIALCDEDSRVRFLDLPKAPARGEANRDAGVRAATGDAIVYLADDDLLMPRHVENVLAGLEVAPFAQSRNGYIDLDDRVRVLPTDLSDPWCRAWHLLDPPRNRVSLTGTAHTVEAYLSLDVGWQVPEPGMWADLTLWRRFFALDGFTAVTRPEMTALQFPANLHKNRSAEQIDEVSARWDAFTREPDAHERLQRLADEDATRELARLSAEVENRVSEEEYRRALAVLDEMRASTSWRVTAPLRAVGRRLRRRVASS